MMFSFRAFHPGCARAPAKPCCIKPHNPLKVSTAKWLFLNCLDFLYSAVILGVVPRFGTRTKTKWPLSSRCVAVSFYPYYGEVPSSLFYEMLGFTWKRRLWSRFCLSGRT
jgi:hypothetical protein